jgi:hypothetical protein
MPFNFLFCYSPQAWIVCDAMSTEKVRALGQVDDELQMLEHLVMCFQHHVMCF